MKLNNNDNDLFKKIKNRKKSIFDYHDPHNNNNDLNKIVRNNNELNLEKKNNDFDKNLISLYRLHSSKFHSQKDKNKQNINEIFKMEVNSLKNEKNKKYKNFENDAYTPNNNDVKNNLIFKKKMAFHYRYINYSPKTKISKQNNFKLQNKKYNKILQISKSIPNLLLLEYKSQKNNMNNINLSYDNNNKKFEDDNLYIHRNSYLKEYGFSSPFKGNRYVGNIYDYYKYNNLLNKENLIYGESKNDNNNNNNIYEQINSIDYEDENNFSQNNNEKSNKKIINRNEKTNKLNIKKISKFGKIQLSSLLIN